MAFAIPSAQAELILTIDDLTNGAGVDAIVADTDSDGLVIFNGAVGNWLLSVTTGISKPLIGKAGKIGMIDLNSVTVSGTTAGSIVMSLTDTDFTVGSGVVPHTILTQNIGGTTSGTITSQAWIDTNNAEFGMDPNATAGPCADGMGPGAFSDSCTQHLYDLSLAAFSMTQVVTFTHQSANQSTSFDSEVSMQVPEPMTLSLVGAGLMGAGFLRRRRRAA